MDKYTSEFFQRYCSHAMQEEEKHRKMDCISDDVGSDGDSDSDVDYDLSYGSTSEL